MLFFGVSTVISGHEMRQSYALSPVSVSQTALFPAIRNQEDAAIPHLFKEPSEIDVSRIVPDHHPKQQEEGHPQHEDGKLAPARDIDGRRG